MMRLTLDQLCIMYAYLVMYRKELERNDLDALNNDDEPQNGERCKDIDTVIDIVMADIRYRSI